MSLTTERTESASTATADDTVEVGEITIQFTAHGEQASKEMEAFREELRTLISGLEASNAVVETYSMPDFDARLAWTRPDSGGDK